MKKKILEPSDATPRVKRRFFSKLILDNSNKCWPWNGTKNANGYGVFNINQNIYIATRVLWTILSGQSLSRKQCVLHRCDNPPCVNPNHLFIGTHRQNMDDCTNKGRRPSCAGERHPLAAFTEQQVIELRLKYPPRYRFSAEEAKAICGPLGVKRQALQMLVNGETWRHLSVPLAALPKRKYTKINFAPQPPET